VDEINRPAAFCDENECLSRRPAGCFRKCLRDARNCSRTAVHPVLAPRVAESRKTTQPEKHVAHVYYKRSQISPRLRRSAFRGGSDTTADPITPDGERPFVRVASRDELLRDGDRVHVQLLDKEGAPRHVSLINHDGDVFAIDSLCYHAGGPLAAGDIEDVGGNPCVSCPWHLYKVTLETGEKLYGSTRLDDDGVTLIPTGITSAGVRQRTHETRLNDDGWYVRLRLAGEVESDKYANKKVQGIAGARVVRVDQRVVSA